MSGHTPPPKKYQKMNPVLVSMEITAIVAQVFRRQF